MLRVFNSINARFDLGEVVYFHFGEIKVFPSEKSQAPYGKVTRRISPESVEVELFQKEIATTHE